MKHFFYILLLISFVGCNTIDRPKKPKNLISKEKMSDIMYDLYILNAAKGVNRKLLELNGIMPSEYIYKKHNIDSLQFAKSNTYYAYDTKVYTSIIEKMSAELQKNKDIYENLNQIEEKAKDSIRAFDKKKRDSKKRVKPDSLI